MQTLLCGLQFGRINITLSGHGLSDYGLEKLDREGGSFQLKYLLFQLINLIFFILFK